MTFSRASTTSAWSSGPRTTPGVTTPVAGQMVRITFHADEPAVRLVLRDRTRPSLPTARRSPADYEADTTTRLGAADEHRH